MAVEQKLPGLCTIEQVQTVLQGVIPGLDEYRKSLGTPAGPAEYDLEQTTSDCLIDVGARVAEAQITLQVLTRRILPDLLDRVSRLGDLSVKFAIITGARQTGAMLAPLYQRLADNFVNQTADLWPFRSSELAEERTVSPGPIQYPVVTPVVTGEGDGSAELVRTFISPDREVRFTGKAAQYLAALDVRDPEGQIVPQVRRDAATTVFGDYTPNTQSGVRHLIDLINKRGTGHGVRIDTLGAEHIGRGALRSDQLVLTTVTSSPNITERNSGEDSATATDFPATFTRGDKTFKGKIGRILAVLDGSRPDFPFRRDLYAAIVFPNVQNPQLSLGECKSRFRDDLATSGLRVESIVGTRDPQNQERKPIIYEWLVKEDVSPEVSAGEPLSIIIPVDGSVALAGVNGSIPVRIERPAEKSLVLGDVGTSMLRLLIGNASPDQIEQSGVRLSPVEQADLVQGAVPLVLEQMDDQQREDALAHVRYVVSLIPDPQTRRAVLAANSGNEDLQMVVAYLSQPGINVEPLLTLTQSTD